jgi:hypothetical protein
LIFAPLLRRVNGGGFSILLCALCALMTDNVVNDLFSYFHRLIAILFILISKRFFPQSFQRNNIPTSYADLMKRFAPRTLILGHLGAIGILIEPFCYFIPETFFMRLYSSVLSKNLPRPGQFAFTRSVPGP